MNEASATPEMSDKKRMLAFLLAFFFGPFGAHRFYVGKTRSAVAMLVISLTVIGLVVTGIWGTIDWVIILFGEFTDKDGHKLTEWA